MQAYKVLSIQIIKEKGEKGIKMGPMKYKYKEARIIQTIPVFI